MDPCFQHITRNVAGSMITDRLTDEQTHRMTTITLAHAPRLKSWNENLILQAGGEIGKIILLAKIFTYMYTLSVA